MKVSVLDRDSVIYIWTTEQSAGTLYYVIHYGKAQVVTAKYNRHESMLDANYILQAVEHGAMLAVLPPHESRGKFFPHEAKQFLALSKKQGVQ